MEPCVRRPETWVPPSLTNCRNLGISPQICGFGLIWKVEETVLGRQGAGPPLIPNFPQGLGILIVGAERRCGYRIEAVLSASSWAFLQGLNW